MSYIRQNPCGPHGQITDHLELATIDLRGWFDSVCFEDWFQAMLLPELKKFPGKHILKGDNLSSHINSSVLELWEENNIKFIALPPKSTHLTQPLDVAFLDLLKFRGGRS